MRWWHGSVTHNREMDVGEISDNEAHPPLVGARSRAVVDALAAGAIVAVPGVGGYSLAVRTGSAEGEARLVELAADPEGPHYAVGRIEDVRTLTSGWNDDIQTLLERCWPGPVEVFMPRAAAGQRFRNRRGGERVDDVRRPTLRQRPPPRRVGGRGGHARRAGIAPAVPRAWSVADRAPPLHRGGGGGPGLSSRRRGGRGRRRVTPGPASHGGRRDGEAHLLHARGFAARPLHSRDDDDERAAQALLQEAATQGGVSPRSCSRRRPV